MSPYQRMSPHKSVSALTMSSSIAQPIPARKVLSGNLRKLLSKVTLASFLHRTGRISAKAARDTVIIDEALLLCTIAFGTVPFAAYVYEKIHGDNKKKTFKGSMTSLVSNTVAHLGKLLVLVYACDIIYQIGVALGLPPSNKDVPREIAVAVYTIWAARVMRGTKHNYIQKKSWGPDKKRHVNRLLNYVINTIAFMLLFGDVLDTLKANFGLQLNSFYKVGGFSTLFAGVAAQRSAQSFISGAIVAMQDNFRKDETVLLDDGTKGKVLRVGLFSTTIETGDGFHRVILNSSLADQNVVNLSRLDTSRIKERAKIRFTDLPRFEEIKKRIKNEIEKSCPNVITDGSKPFRMFCTKWDDEWAQVTIECHLDIPPLGGKFLKAREGVLEAMARGGYVDTSGYLNAEPPKES